MIQYNCVRQQAERMEYLKILLIFVVFPVFASLKKPNIIFILTDDQDVEIGGQIPIAKTRKLIGDAGITFKNMFVTSPLCCPSRSSIMTGRYTHNHNALNNSLTGNCSSTIWQKESEPKAFAPYLKQQGYNTFFAGKYLNQYGFPESGGVQHIPPGWDDWYGLVGNSRYYNYAVSNNGKREYHGETYPDDYLTYRIGRRALAFLEQQQQTQEEPMPFFMMLATPACHAPFTPAPQYMHNFSDVQYPKNGSFNTVQQDKHWLMRQVINPMDQKEIDYIAPTFVNRWRTLLTVDDIVEDIVTMLKEKSLLDNTYLFFSSDNGFHLGQFSLPNDKRQMYEFDIRVPFMARGPGIKPGQVREEIILNIDFGPTFVDLAGGQPPAIMDGSSFKEILMKNDIVTYNSWREDFAVEHFGEYEDVADCPQWKDQRMGNCYPSCVCEDSWNNTYDCVRWINQEQNLIYCRFVDNEGFVEAYDLNKDPHQMTNIVQTMDPVVLHDLQKRLHDLSQCSGPSCRNKRQPRPAVDHL